MSVTPVGDSRAARAHGRVAPMKTNRLPLLVSLVLFASMLVACAPSVDGDEDEPSESSSDALLRRSALGAKGDACTYPVGDGTTVPGTENDLGECCRNTDPKDCIVILKPFPTLVYSFQ